MIQGKIQLEKVSLNDVAQLWQMQRIAFSEFLVKYQDTETNPACETLECLWDKLTQPDASFYWIKWEEELAGGIRIITQKNESKRISPLFVLPQYRDRGIAQRAIKLVEELYGEKDWMLSTILQEKGNCHLYEKAGYRPTGETREINSNMTLIFYKK